MFNLKIKLVILTVALFFGQNALASTAIDSTGTGSASSYTHGEQKGDGSKTKTMPQHLSESKGHHISGNSSHHKSEGSASKHSAKSGHGYSKGSHRGHGGHSSKCPFSHLLRFKDKLGLTDAQVAEVKRLRFKYQKQSIRNKADHKIAHIEFDRQIHAEKVDENAIRLAAGEIARTKTDKIMAMANAKIALLNLLTEEQRKKAHTMHSAH